MFQSTHPRGVRRRRAAHLPGRDLFQSTHPRGVRRQGLTIKPMRRMFQSTHPRGVRLRAGAGASGAKRFNPRTRVGCDDYFAMQVAQKLLFQSTHPRGVRRDIRSHLDAGYGFQSTHPRGVRPMMD